MQRTPTFGLPCFVDPDFRTSPDSDPPPPSGSGPRISFVIPAFNEEAVLPHTLRAIHRAMEGALSYEILVVDNGSTDRTPEIASELGGRVVSRPEGTIASLRNEGARQARGPFLIFLDADVVVTPGWGEQLPETLAELERYPRTLSGGMCVVPGDASWVERLWFAPREREAFSHIGTGHLLTTRAFFQEVGGFDETLETGEDFEFSHRAAQAGGRIAPEAKLVAEHRGFPRTLGAFVRREAWHGKSDFVSLRSALGSKVALASLAFALAHGVGVAGLLLGLPGVALLAGGFLAALCGASSWVKYRRQPWSVILGNAALYYLYYWGRAFSLWKARRRSQGQRKRG